MGKKDFHLIYQDAVRELKGRPKMKLSTFCHLYEPKRNYAGIIIYHTYGRFKWQQRPGQGLAAGYRGRAFYVLILCTDNWPEYALKAAGQGRVHDYLYRQYFDMEWTDGKTCCGGFAILNDEIRFSSIWLNCQRGCVNGLSWETDGDKNLSPPEQTLVCEAINAWKLHGGGQVVDVPDTLHEWCVNMPPPSKNKVPTEHFGPFPPPPLHHGVKQGCACTIM